MKINKLVNPFIATGMGAYMLIASLSFVAGQFHIEDPKVSQENCSRYKQLARNPKSEQEAFIRNDLERRYFSYRCPFGVGEEIKDYSVNLIIEDLENNCFN